MPGGLGFHPWFRRPVRVAIAAAAVHPSNLATEPRARPGHRLDATAAPLEAMPDGLDATWTDLGRAAGRPRLARAGIRATMTVDAPEPVHRRGQPGRARTRVAVEPQTHAPDGIRRLLDGEPGGLALHPAGRVARARRAARVRADRAVRIVADKRDRA